MSWILLFLNITNHTKVTTLYSGHGWPKVSAQFSLMHLQAYSQFTAHIYLWPKAMDNTNSQAINISHPHNDLYRHIWSQSLTSSIMIWSNLITLHYPEDKLRSGEELASLCCGYGGVNFINTCRLRMCGSVPYVVYSIVTICDTNIKTSCILSYMK